MEDKRTSIRQVAESDLEAFIRLVHPGRVLGSVHQELIRWWTRQDQKNHQLTLLPRDHQKSALIAYRVAWEITKNPAIRVLYISSTANLAEKQIKFIKDILTSTIYRKYWPEMVSEDPGLRERWTTSEFSVDHPIRKIEAVRDPTVFTAGLTTSITGLHCDIAVLDDVVVKENAYTEEGREKTRQQYSLLASIEGADAKEWVVGTRYHPKDLYNDLMEQEVEEFDVDTGEIVGREPLYEVFQREVENQGDGTGEFLWPRQQRSDGKWFGFDIRILAEKRAKYLDRTQFRAQYYNNPNSIDEATINPALFQYYDQKHITRTDGRWYYRNDRINVFAAIDFAYSLSSTADYTTIVVLGIDSRHNYYVLEIDRFKTDRVSVYFEHILHLHQKWDFRKLRAEVTAAQKVIVTTLKDAYIKPYGLALSIDEHSPSRIKGSKEERIEAILQPRYQNLQMFHYRGGNCQVLEEELVLKHPPHDDVKDSLASCIEICIAPSQVMSINQERNKLVSITNNRFGGISVR